MISVIMLAHNRADFMCFSIESILKQTYSEFELIIIDNNSTDSTADILASYRQKDNRIRTLKRQDGNIGAGRNLGLDNAKGEFFTFFDDDDYCEPDYLEFLHKLAVIHDADIAVCGSSYDINGEIKPKYVFDELVLCDRHQAVENFLLRKYFNSGNPTKLFRRTQEISNIRYSENGKYDDIHTMYKFFAAAGQQPFAVAARGEAKYVFRRHGANNSTATLNFEKLTPEWLNEYLAAYLERTEYISEKLPALSKLARWSKWSYMISMVEKINRFALSDCSVQLEYMIAQLLPNKDEFVSAKWTRDFEKEWIKEYVK